MSNLTQISEDLQRIIDAKAQLITEIRAKGITVADNTPIENLAALVKNISSSNVTVSPRTITSIDTITYALGYVNNTFSVTPSTGTAFGTVTVDLGLKTSTLTPAHIVSGQSVLGLNGTAIVKSDVNSVVTNGIPMSGNAPCALTIKFWGAGVTSYTPANLTSLSISAGFNMSGSQANFKPQLNTPFFIEPVDIDEWAITIGQIPNNIDFIASSGSCIIGVAKASRVGTLTINEY